MDLILKNKFITLYKKYFNNSGLPITFRYSNETGNIKKAKSTKEWNCLICELAKVRNGESVYYSADEVKCGGAKRYLGFTNKMRKNFEYFLSCGIDGKMEGERYIKTPEMVLQILENQSPLPIEGKYIIFKRWDKLEENDDPDVVIFFVKPEALSGLFTLANYDQTEPNSTFTPFGAGCSSIVYYPYMEKYTERPRAVIGMFDPSARPCVPVDTLSFAVPMRKFEKMINYMEESFLITDTWKNVMQRMK